MKKIRYKSSENWYIWQQGNICKSEIIFCNIISAMQIMKSVPVEFIFCQYISKTAGDTVFFRPILYNKNVAVLACIHGYYYHYHIEVGGSLATKE